METAAFDYDLPAAAVAQRPAAERDAARLLVDRGAGTAVEHRFVRDLPELCEPGDLLVVNATRVLSARLLLRKATGGEAEVLLLTPHGDGHWEALVRPGRRLAPGTRLRLREAPPAGSPAGDLEVLVGEDLGEGRRCVALRGVDDELAAIEAVGEVPLPPYIDEPLADPERYQTVFAQRAASVAAPTAGLHLTEDLLARCSERGVDIATVELEIGLATFRPIATQRVEEHRMHAERYVVPAATREACQRARERGGRVVAVGTTVVRSLEAWASSGKPSGSTDLFITPGFAFGVVDRLLTNFHLPRSSLLVLVEAFAGPRWRELYREALEAGYRFLSFGDAMFVERAR